MSSDEAPKPRCFLCGGPVTVTDGSTASESEDYAHDSCQEKWGEGDPMVLENTTLSQLDEAIELGRELAQLRAENAALHKEHNRLIKIVAATLHALPGIQCELGLAALRVEVGITTQENLGIKGHGSLHIAREHLKEAIDAAKALDLVLRGQDGAGRCE